MIAYYDIIKKDISSHAFFSEDAYHDTYISLLSDTHTNISVSLLQTFYRHILRKGLSKLYIECELNEQSYKLIADDMEYEQSTDALHHESITGREVKEYAKRTLSDKDFKIFTLRFVKGLTLTQIGEYIGWTPVSVMRHEREIKSRIINHFKI